MNDRPTFTRHTCPTCGIAWTSGDETGVWLGHSRKECAACFAVLVASDRPIFQVSTKGDW